MYDFFVKLLNRSLAAGIIVLVIVVLRLLLKRAPRNIICLLWALVALRLILPFSIQSNLSAFHAVQSSVGDQGQIEYFQYNGKTEKPRVEFTVSALVNDNMAPESMTIGEHTSDLYLPPVVGIWLAGICVMLLYAIGSYLHLRKKTAASLPQHEGFRMSDDISTPFILGILKPVIYVPSGMDGKTLHHVIAHEEAHIRRRDHWWKPLGYLLLTVYWFNPILWLAYVLLCRDIEMACDEKVIRDMDKGSIAEYSQALLDCSLPRRRIAACPLAFGEVGVKERVKSVLNYKKPAFWIIAVAVVACIVVAVCFGTNPAGTVLAKWDTDTVDMNKVLDDVHSLSVQYWNTSVDCNDSETNRFLATMSKIKVGRKPISISRDEGRSAVFIITINEHLKLNFNESFNEIWVDNGVKPSYTYKITNPATAEELLLDFSFTAYGDSTKWDCSVICVETSTPDHYVINYSDVKVSSQTGTLTFQNRNDFDIVVHILREGETEVVSDRIPAGGCYSLLKVNDKPCTIGVHADVDVNTEIKLFVYDGKWSEPYSMAEHIATKWFDCLHGDEMVWDGRRETDLDEFPGVTFRWFSEKLEAVTEKETITLYTGMPIWNVYFCDLNGDGKRELCATARSASEEADNRILVEDYANHTAYQLSDPGRYDYSLICKDGQLWAEKRAYMQDTVLESGPLVLRKLDEKSKDAFPVLMIGQSRLQNRTDADIAFDGSPAAIGALREKYPEYFDLPTGKGLEVYVWQMAQNSYSFGVLSGTNRNKSPEELWNLKGVSAEEMKAILSTYDIDEQNIFIYPWQNPISSYIAEYWITQEGEEQSSIEARQKEYTDHIRKMLFDGTQDSQPSTGQNIQKPDTGDLTLTVTAAKDDIEFLLTNGTDSQVEIGDYNCVQRLDGSQWTVAIDHSIDPFPAGSEIIYPGESLWGMAAWVREKITLDPGHYKYLFEVFVRNSDTGEIDSVILEAEFDIK